MVLTKTYSNRYKTIVFNYNCNGYTHHNNIGMVGYEYAFNTFKLIPMEKSNVHSYIKHRSSMC